MCFFSIFHNIFRHGILRFCYYLHIFCFDDIFYVYFSIILFLCLHKLTVHYFPKLAQKCPEPQFRANRSNYSEYTAKLSPTLMLSSFSQYWDSFTIEAIRKGFSCSIVSRLWIT